MVFLTKVRKTGMPIRRLREYAELVRAGRGNEDERLALLEQHRDAVLARMEETRRNLEGDRAKDRQLPHANRVGGEQLGP